MAKTARRLENDEVIDKFRNLRELLGLRRRFSHVKARSHLRDTLNCARENAPASRPGAKPENPEVGK